jgi:hypothetical protein
MDRNEIPQCRKTTLSESVQGSNDIIIKGIIILIKVTKKTTTTMMVR